jgi:nitroreductase
MELKDAIVGRSSIRHFKETKVPKYLIKEFLLYADYAPSAGNLQSRVFITVDSPVLIKKLSEAACQDFIAEAPVVLVACALQLGDNRYGDRGRDLYSIMDTSAAIQNLLLVVYEAGLGACWVGAFDEDKVRVTLDIESYERPIAIIPIGYDFLGD